MTPQELEDYYVSNKHIPELHRKIALGAAIEYTLFKAKKVIQTLGNSRIEIENYQNNNGIKIYAYEIYDELEALGYNVSGQTLGYEEESEDYYYLHFKLKDTIL